MNFWQFLDAQFARCERLLGKMSGGGVAGAGIFGLTIAVLWLAAGNPDLRADELFRVLAQAIVVQGLIGLAMASWFTVRHREPAGTPDDPVSTDEVRKP